MPRTYIELGEWLPDLQDFTKPGLRRCFGVFPKASSYESFNQQATFSTNSLLKRCQGAIIAQDSTATYNFAGDASALYVMTATTFLSVTRAAGSGGAYSVVGTDAWHFTQFGSRVLAVNGHNATTTSFTDHTIQTCSLGPIGTFANLTGAGNMAAKTIAVVRDFVVVGNVMHADSASGTFTQRVRWCGVNDPTTWTANATTMADHQDLVGNGGEVMRIVGGEYGVVFMRNAIYRMDFVGSPLIFQFDQVQQNLGAVARNAIASYQNMIFFLSDTGFYAFDGSTVTPIGRGKVDDAFWKAKLPEVAVDKRFLDRVVAEIDPENKLVMWSYPSASNSGSADTVLVYSWAFNRWSALILQNIQRVTQHISAGGATTLAVYNNSNGLSRFTGAQGTAAFTLAELQFNPKGLSTLMEARPYYETSGTAAVCVVTDFIRATLDSTFSAGAIATATSGGRGVASMRSTGKYHAIQMVIAPVSATIHHIYGIDIEFQPHGWR